MLKKTVVSFPLGVGLDTKSDKKQVAPGRLLELENYEFTKIGKLSLRAGQRKLSDLTITGLSIGSPKELSTFKDELSITNGDSFFAYSEANDRWINKGSLAAASAESVSVVRNVYQQVNADSASSQGIAVYAWEDSSGGVRCTCLNIQNGQPLFANELIDANGSRPKVSVNDSYFYIHYVDIGATSLKVRRIPISDPTNIGASATLAVNTHATDAYFDIAKFGNAFVLGYRTSTPEIRLGYIKSDGTFAAAIDGYPSPVTISVDPQNCLNVHCRFENDPSNDGIFIFWHDGTSGTQGYIYDLGLTLSGGLLSLDASTVTVRNIGSVNRDATTVEVFYEVTAAQPHNHFVKRCLVYRDGTVTTQGVFMRSVGLYSKPFMLGSTLYVVLAHQSALQSTYYTVAETKLIANRIAYQVAGGHTNKASSLASVSAISSTSFNLATLVKGRLVSEAGNLFGLLGVQSTTLDFDNSRLFISQEIQNNLLIAAGMLYGYDGNSLNELGFNLWPENGSVADGGAGSITAGTRFYKLMYEWQDQQGNVHRSAPSPAISFTSGASRQASIMFPTLRVTEKQGVSLVVYRTIDGGTSYYRVTSVSSPTINSKSVDSLTITDNVPDSSLTANEILYTTGGVLENIAPPSGKALGTYFNRMILMGLEDENQFWFSKIVSQGSGVEFTDSFTGRVDQGEGGILCGAQLDEKFILFKSRSMFVLAGQGPEDTGFNNDFGQPQLIASDVGCSEPKSVVKTPLGLMFKSAKGFYLVNRALQVTYLGSPVEAFNSLSVSSAELIDDKNQVRFTHSDGSMVVYDYFFNQWSSFTNYQAISAINWNSQFVIAKEDGKILVESSDTSLDAGSPILPKVVTPWVSLGDLQGFQRIYRAIFLGDYISKHILRVRVGYNFEESYREDFTISSDGLFGDYTWGSDSVWGDSDAYGGTTDATWQFMVKPRIQKCQSIRFEITSLNPESIDGAMFSLSSMLVEVGLKGGTNRLGKTKVMQVTT